MTEAELQELMNAFFSLPEKAQRDLLFQTMSLKEESQMENTKVLLINIQEAGQDIDCYIFTRPEPDLLEALGKLSGFCIHADEVTEELEDAMTLVNDTIARLNEKSEEDWDGRLTMDDAQVVDCKADKVIITYI